MKTIITLLLFSMAAARLVYAHGECCLSKSLTDATTSTMSLSQNFGLSLQYEYSNMKTIRDGDDRVRPDDVLEGISARWPATLQEARSFTVPTRMIMQKYTLLGVYRFTEKIQFLASLPYVINDMNMRMVTRGANGGQHHHAVSDTPGNDVKMDMKMSTVEGMGDMTLMGLYTIYADNVVQPEKKLVCGLGLKSPTGENDETTDEETLVHATMQPGTGSWDPLFLTSYLHTFSPWVFQTNLFYHLTTEGDEGYEFGDKLSLDLIGRYRAVKYVSPGVELNGLYMGKDRDHDGKYSRPEESLLDNTDNTGITSLSITPTIQVNIPKTGGSLDLKFQKPLYQHVNGIQQVVDWRAVVSLVWAF